MFDEDAYPQLGERSGLANVLAIDLYTGHEYAERMTVARIHVKTWEEAGPQISLVQLAQGCNFDATLGGKSRHQQGLTPLEKSLISSSHWSHLPLVFSCI